MTFTIQKGNFDVYFINWLLRRTQRLLLKNVKPKKLSAVTARFVVENPLHLRPEELKGVDISRGVLESIFQLNVRESKLFYVFYIPDNVYLSNTRIKLSTLSRFVNYGSLHTKGYPLFTAVFNHVKANLSQYYNEYLYEFL